MFAIPDMYKMNMSFETAEHVMSSQGENGVTIIDAMENLCSEWNWHCNGADFFADDDEFFEFFQYEANAFNVLYTEMKHLLRYGI
jgi:hypothetical protein